MRWRPWAAGPDAAPAAILPQVCAHEEHDEARDSDEQGPSPADRIEAEIVGHMQQERLSQALTAAIVGYGPELLGYLHAMLPAGEADDLYSLMCERMWRGLPNFRWDSSFRTWAYTIARNLIRDRHRARRGPAGRIMGLSEVPEVAEIAEQVRSTTEVHLKTETKTRLQQVRDALEPDDRTLLILRVDRRLAWRDIARVMSESECLGDAEVGRLAARLRKRYERLKERLRAELATDS